MKQKNSDTPTNLPCTIIQDLLPSCADGLASAETIAAVCEHTSHCASCARTLKDMKRPDVSRNDTSATRELDYLKKIRCRGKRNLLAVSLLTMFLFLILIGIGCYGIGFEAKGVADYTVYPSLLFTDNETPAGTCIILQGNLQNPSMVWTDTNIRMEGNIAYITFRERLAFPWERNFNFYAAYEVPDSIHQVFLYDNVVWENGALISSRTNQIYQEKHLYIGDMSANGALAIALGIAETFGNYKNSLQTSAEPYSWTLQFEDPILNEAAFNQKMQSYACVLLALVDNLGEVSWEYRLAANNTDTFDINTSDADAHLRKNTLSTTQAGIITGKDIKDFSLSISALQELLDILYLY